MAGVHVALEPRQLLEHLQVALDDGQQIVEVVGDAAGELPDALQALRVAQVLLGLRPLQAAREQVAERLEEANLVVAESAVLARAHCEHAHGPAAIGQRHRERADQPFVEIDAAAP